MATRSPRPASTWRSTQLDETWSLPSTNHFANGGLLQSRTWFHSESQVSNSRAWRSQKASRSALASSYIAAVALAWAANSSDGGKRRSSCRRLDRASFVTFVCSSCHRVRQCAETTAVYLTTATSDRQGRRPPVDRLRSARPR